MHRYKELLRFPNAWVLILAALPARISYGMIGLAIFFKTEQETNSVAIAGLAIGINSLAGSLTAGVRGSIMDKWGQRWPLRIFVPCYAAMLLAINMAHDRNILLIAAFVLGITAPPINLSVRPLWKDVVPPDFLRVAYAVDSAIMNFAGVIGPVLATSLALSSHPGSALSTTSAMMFIGGTALGLTSISRNWIPEKKVKGADSLWRSKPLQLLMIEGCFIGFGWGLFDVAVPAFATLEGVPQRTAWIFGAMGVANVVGGLLAGLVSKNRSALATWRKSYSIWFLISIPIAFTYPGWSMALFGAALGLVGGAIQVFYWEVMEAIRPKGSQTAALGWLWSVEGSFMALGSALGGYLSEMFSPRLVLA
ncbi:MAG: MFS transporter, partial [Actinobacteria bacterium]|nr:MFS transporter [Actinomycetota bacterium]